MVPNDNFKIIKKKNKTTNCSQLQKRDVFGIKDLKVLVFKNRPHKNILWQTNLLQMHYYLVNGKILQILTKNIKIFISATVSGVIYEAE